MLLIQMNGPHEAEKTISQVRTMGNGSQRKHIWASFSLMAPCCRMSCQEKMRPLMSQIRKCLSRNQSWEWLKGYYLLCSHKHYRQGSGRTGSSRQHPWMEQKMLPPSSEFHGGCALRFGLCLISHASEISRLVHGSNSVTKSNLQARFGQQLQPRCMLCSRTMP